MSDQALPIITELCPKPNNGIEWVELYNPSTDSVDLAGWQIWDQLSQPSLLYSFADFSLGPHTFVVVEVGKKLNDTGDGVILLDSESSVVDVVNYQSAQPNLGYSRTALQNSANFSWQTTTPNSFLSPTAVPSPSVILELTPPSSETTPSPTLVLIPSKMITPLKSPTPSKTPTPTQLQTPTPSPKVTTPTPILPTITPATSVQLKPYTSTVLPNIPSLDSLATHEGSNDVVASQSSDHSSTEPPKKLDRLVFFPSSKNPFAARNVIIGGLVLCSHAGLAVWFDWQKHRVSTYY